MRVSVAEVLSVVSFALALSVSSLKTWSVLARVDLAPSMYIAGAMFSMLMCSLLLLSYASLRAWRRAH